MPGTKRVHKQPGEGIDYREIDDKFGASASTACKKVNTAGTDENLFRLVLVPGHGARVLPLELVRHSAASLNGALFRALYHKSNAM